MPKRRILRNGLAHKVLQSCAPDRDAYAEDELAPRNAFDIDELTASPWIGLHFRHEFMLHYRHELLGQRLSQ